MAMDWPTFTEESEVVKPDAAAAKAVAAFFKDKVGLAAPSGLEGYSEENLKTKGLDALRPAHRALAVRVFRSADAVYTAKRLHGIVDPSFILLVDQCQAWHLLEH